jgi:drug/metabolite transporter (DMT)-like permease
MTWEQIGEIAAVGTAVLWTLSTLAWTSAGRHIGALPVSFLRLVIACVPLAAYGAVVRGHWLPTEAGSHTWLILGVSGLFGFFLADLCLFKAFLLIGPRLSLLLQSFTPPVTALISWWFLRDQLAWRQWLAMVITLTGVVWVVLEQPANDAERLPWKVLSRGIFLALISAVAAAVGYVLSKRGIGDCDPVAATFIRILGAMAGYIVLVTLFGRWNAIAAASRHTRAMGIITLGAMVGPFLGVALCMVALRYCRAGVTATIISTMPVLILPFLVVLYREKVSLRAAGGAVVSVAGVALLMMQPATDRRASERPASAAIVTSLAGYENFCPGLQSQALYGSSSTHFQYSESTPGESIWPSHTATP